MVVEQVLADLTRDPWPCAATERPARCVGAALRIASCIMEKTLGKQGGRIQLFLGGPCTVGPGATVARPLTEMMRDHNELTKGTAALHKPAVAFYKSLAVRAPCGMVFALHTPTCFPLTLLLIS